MLCSEYKYYEDDIRGGDGGGKARKQWGSPLYYAQG